MRKVPVLRVSPHRLGVPTGDSPDLFASPPGLPCHTRAEGNYEGKAVGGGGGCNISTLPINNYRAATTAG